MACKGQRFDPAYLHQKDLDVYEKKRIFANLDFNLALFLSIILTSMSPSSRGLGHLPFTEATGVRIPVGTPHRKKPLSIDSGFFLFGYVFFYCPNWHTLSLIKLTSATSWLT